MNQHDIDARALALLTAADRLAAHNPTEYQNFVRAFGSYAEVSNMRLLNAPAQEVQNVQGQARAMFEMTMLLVECRKNLETLIAKTSAQARAQKPRGTP